LKEVAALGMKGLKSRPKAESRSGILGESGLLARVCVYVSSSSRVWGRAPAKKELVHFRCCGTLFVEG